MISQKQQIIEYLLTNPVDDTEKNKYKRVIQEFGITVKTASAYWIEARKIISGPSKRQLTQNKGFDSIPEFDNKLPEVTQEQADKIVNQSKDSLTVTTKSEFEVKTLEDLFIVCDVDTTIWEVIGWQCKKWDLGIKNLANEIETKALFSVSAKFRPIKVEDNLPLQKEAIIQELFNRAPLHNDLNAVARFRDQIRNTEGYGANLLEIALFDVHFGKLAHSEEVGEDYDLKIACKRYKNAVKDLLSRVNLDSVERILLPIGQDLINIDNIVGTTTAGTPQDTDSRFHKIVKTVKAVLIETINMLVSIAPVDVVITVGNHDEQTTFMIGEMLDAYYHNASDVVIYNGATLRKYYEYGVNSIMFTHGNKEKFNELGMVFAAENPKLWANTTQRFIQIGHFHHNKKITTLQAQEFQGFQVQILPSISGADAWHKGKGYQSQKQAKAFLFNRRQGLIGEFTHTAV